MAELWLVTGVPGAGKTCLGEYLEKNHNFQHYDFETNIYNDFINDKENFINKIKLSNKDMVITWGFGPDSGGIALVVYLRQNGFKLFWLDGNRVGSFKAFLMRGDVSLEAYYFQMYRIENSKVIDILKPIQMNPFNNDYSFRDKEELIKEMKVKNNKFNLTS